MNIGNSYLSNELNILNAQVNTQQNQPGPSGSTVVTLTEQDDINATYTLSPIVSTTTYYVFSSPLQYNTPVNVAVDNINSSHIGDIMVLLFAGDETHINNDGSISIYFSSDFYYYACGSRSDNYTLESEGTRSAQYFTFDGTYWVNSYDNC